ncbi:serine/threonine protein kinase [Nonomuraea sp. CA-218870]|uniref:serine/threonine protein kinase n=1 Tax=Nonomuraea sp. CA-218870 TaxID=3239998 RepID=UPI003D91AB4E
MPSISGVRPLRANDPREIAGYALSGRLGEGGQGTVFLAESDSGERVAVKLLHADFGDDADARRYFHRELAALQRVAPFCTARVLAADPESDPPYVISEYVEGPSLQEAVRERGVLAGTDLDRLAVATATALGAIHAAGIVHRDFKPGNVLLAADGPRVIDFGIARPFEGTAAPASGVVGTPAYMAPEQLSGHPAGAPLDLFAWACTIAFAANGRPPFGQEPMPAVINRILNGTPDLGRLSGRLRDFVAACLAKDPARRPTAEQVLLGLMNRNQEAMPTARPGTLPPPSGTPVPLPPPSALRSGPQSGPPSGPQSGPGPGGAWGSASVLSGAPATQPGRRRAGMVIGASLVAGAVAVATVAVTLALNLDRPTGGATSGPTPSASGTPSPVRDQVARSPRLGIEVWQGGTASTMAFSDRDREITRVTMKAEPFELRFPTLAKDTAAQICAWTDDSVLRVEQGAKVEDHTCYAPGTGIADYEHGSGTLWMDERAHNHLVDTRVAEHSDTQDKVLFSTISQNGAATPAGEWKGEVYLSFFVDRDGDKRFDLTGPAEYEYLVLEFPR